MLKSYIKNMRFGIRALKHLAHGMVQFFPLKITPYCAPQTTEKAIPGSNPAFNFAPKVFYLFDNIFKL